MSPGDLLDRTTVLDMLHASNEIVSFAAGVDESKFLSDKMLVSAVCFQILILGEAVKRLTLGFRDRYSDVPWKRVAGMRDRIIHSYDDIDLAEVWKVATVHVPALKEQLDRIASELGDQ